MKRSQFVSGLGAGAAAAASHGALAAGPAIGTHTTIDALFSGLPPVTARSWVQYIMGSGVVYSKKVGVGRETTSLGVLPYIETQIGDAQATCNPNTIKKAYTEPSPYGELLAPHDVKLYVVKAGTAFSVLNTDASDKLYLLDADNLYSRARARVVAAGPEAVRMHKRTLPARRIELAFAPAGPQSLRTLTLWLNPAIPFGVARMHATLDGAEPFDLRVDSFGDGYFSLVPESLDSLREAGA